MKNITAILLAVLSLFCTSGGYRNAEESVVQEPIFVSVVETVVQRPASVVESLPSVEETVEEELVQPVKTYDVNREDQIALAQTAYGEYFLTDTPEHKMYAAAVMWCCCWHSFWGTTRGLASTVKDACAEPYHFMGYSPDNPLSEDLMALAEDVLVRFYRYCNGESFEDVGCVLPPEYIFFSGNGMVNVFRDQYEGGRIWDWSLPNPYE